MARPRLLLADDHKLLLNGLRKTRILFLTMHTDRIYLEEAFRARAPGYVLKQAGARELVEAIGAVGRSCVSSEISARLCAGANRDPVQLFGGRFTPRQREVLQPGVRTTAELARYAQAHGISNS
jgi:DNA-binding NarL/FixJ family response regulator